MKKIITIALITSTALPTHLSAKGQCGIYVKSSDYKDKHPSIPLECTKGNTTGTLKLHDFLWKSKSITYEKSGKVVKMKKDNLFGYCDATNTNYRFYQDDAYQIITALPIAFYKKDKLEPTGKTYHRVPEYFFSKTIDSPICALTPGNMEAVFSAFPEFIEQIQLSRCFSGTNYSSEHLIEVLTELYNKTNKN